MNHSDKLSFNLDLLSKKTFVYDIIYSPRKTELLKKADSLGLKKFEWPIYVDKTSSTIFYKNGLM